MYKKLSALCLCILLLCNCRPGADRTWTNEEIEADIQAEIKSRNEQLLNALKQDNIPGFKALASDTLLAGWGPENDESLHSLHQVMHSTAYRILDAFMVRAVPGNGKTLNSTSGEGAYTLDFIPLTRESYITVLLIPDGANEILLRLVYGRYEDEWKLNSLNFAYYAFAGKNALAFHTKAHKAYERGNLVNAFNNADLAVMLLNSEANAPLIRFDKEKEILDFRNKLHAEMKANYDLPAVLENIETRPRIFQLSSDLFADDFYPSVSYQTHILFTDSLALYTEYEQLRREAKKMFRGIDQDNAYIIFKASNHILRGQASVKNYVFIDTLR